MISIGTSGWMYPHWVGRFYPQELPSSGQLSYYARYFSTVEINRSFYRLPSREQFQAWAAQTAAQPGFCFAVKASRYVTHLKKLRGVEEGVTRLLMAAEGLGDRLGPFLYQLPPHWHADPERLADFIALLPREHRVAFEFRDPSWFDTAIMDILREAGCALVVAIGGPAPTPLETPAIGPFSYIRFHHGAQDIGLSDGEIAFWAQRIAADAAAGRDVYAYFNNDWDAHAVADARRLREAIEKPAAPR